jgi:hypothetical protein
MPALEDIATRSGGETAGRKGSGGAARSRYGDLSTAADAVRCECCDFGSAGAYLLTFYYKPGLSLPV